MQRDRTDCNRLQCSGTGKIATGCNAAGQDRLQQVAMQWDRKDCNRLQCSGTGQTATGCNAVGQDRLQ